MTDVLKSFYLAGWYVDTGTNRLVQNEKEVKLESKVMAVLHFLAQHKGELVSREVLEQAVWKDTVVGYDALTNCIAKLRKVLDDNPRQPEYIETISKKGYRLIAEVSQADTPPDCSNAPPSEPKPQRSQAWIMGVSSLR